MTRSEWRKFRERMHQRGPKGVPLASRRIKPNLVCARHNKRMAKAIVPGKRPVMRCEECCTEARRSVLSARAAYISRMVEGWR